MASRLQDVILRGLASARPLFSAVAPGTLYYSTDTQKTERNSGTAWESYSDSASGGVPGAHAPSHGAGGSDPVTLAQSQITNLTTDLAAKAALTDPRFTDARTPLPHAPSHSAASTDPVNVLNLGGFPGGATAFLRADATFAAPPGGPHAPSHSNGGADPVTVTNLAGYPGGTTNFLRADGTFAAPPAIPVRIGSITMVIDGGVSVITNGLKGYLEVPFACTIQAVTLLADVSGSIVVDIWKDTFAAYPPVVADSITAAAKPTITTALKSQDVTLTGWNKNIAAGDILGFNVDSVTSIKKVTLSLKIQAV